jgi:hypothetical protein
MFIPYQIVQVLHDERIEEALNDAKIRHGYLPQDEGIHILAAEEYKWRIRLFTITALVSFLKRIWNWRFTFQQTDCNLVYESCED